MYHSFLCFVPQWKSCSCRFHAYIMCFTLEEKICTDLLFAFSSKKKKKVVVISCLPCNFIYWKKTVGSSMISLPTLLPVYQSLWFFFFQSLVPLGSVEELLAVYDSQRRELPPPVTVWEWGWTKSAETWNGRAAMLAVLVLLVLEVTTGEGFLHQWGILPLLR